VSSIRIRPATPEDTPLVLRFIRDLAEYEKLPHEVVATEERIQKALFGPRPYAEVAFACIGEEEVGFALFFHNFSTFLGLPGIYLEDLFVRPSARGHGVGRRLLVHLAQLARDRGCGRLEWAVLDWNESAIGFYRGLGAKLMEAWKIFRLTGDALHRLASEGEGKPT
jgi:GNAT superfamily N-acetyltransferase